MASFSSRVEWRAESNALLKSSAMTRTNGFESSMTVIAVFGMELVYCLAASCVMPGTKYCAVQSITGAATSTLAPTVDETHNVLWRKFIQCLPGDMSTSVFSVVSFLPRAKQFQVEF